MSSFENERKTELAIMLGVIGLVVLLISALAINKIYEWRTDLNERVEIREMCETGPADIRYDCKAFGLATSMYNYSMLCFHCKREEHGMCDRDDWSRTYIIKHCFLKDLEE